MTKKLSTREKANRRVASKQQKAASKTVVKVTQPKPEEPPASPVNLCDDCAYEFGECEGKPKFASDKDETLTRPEADRVIECPAFVNVAKMPTADQLKKKAAEMQSADIDFPDLVLLCVGGCGRTTEDMTEETKSGEFKRVSDIDFPDGVPEWTCQDCLDQRAAEGEARICDVEHLGNFPDCFRDCPKDKCDGVPAAGAHAGGDEGPGEAEEEPEDQVIRTDLPEQPDPKRFQVEEDFGICPSCETAMKRTALNRYQDAIRCTNGRCRAYRAIVKTISTGVK